jgi:hypothetical protein
MVEVNKTGIFLSIVLLSILAINTANAADIIVSVNPIDELATGPGDNILYVITFYNMGDTPVAVSTNLLQFSLVDYLPDGKSYFTVPADSSYNLTLNITLTENEAKLYGSIDGKKTNQVITIYADGENLKSPVYLPVTVIYKNAPAVWSTVKSSNVQIVPAEINPKEPFSIKFTINNPKAATVDATMISGELPLSIPRLLIPNGTNEISVNDLKIPDTARPGQYGMTLRLVFLDATHDIPITLTVGSFGACVVKEDVKSGVLGKVYTATLSVDGNIEKTCSVSTKLFGIERNLVTDKSDNYVYSDKDISWQVNVQPGSSVQVGYTLSYLPIIAVPFVIILLAGAWWYFTRKVEVEKELVDYRRHPGFMDLKIQLKVKNLTNGNLTNVRLIEPLPAFAKEIKDFGTVPGTLTVHNKGKAVKWELDHLKSKEERIFSYRIRTSVEVIGRMSFPPAVMKYTTANGESLEETSNILAVEVE